MRHPSLILLTAVLAACGPAGTTVSDAGPSPDALPADHSDAGNFDARAPDANGSALPGVGGISGECGVLDDAEWSSDAAFYVHNVIDFGADGYDTNNLSALTAGGQEIVADDNAGGSSLWSEVFAFEVLHRCEGAILLKTETEIVYTPPQTKITDLLVTVDGHKLGVSVTRAVGYPRDDPYAVSQAAELLEGKLADILVSSASVAPEDAWERQLLHVLAYAPEHAASLATAFGQLDESLRANTIVIVTVTDGEDAFLY